MYSFISLSKLRPLLSNSLIRRLPHARFTPQLASFSQNLTGRPQESYVNQIVKSNYISKRPFSEWFTKNIERNRTENHAYLWLVERLTAIGSLTSFLAIFIHPCENTELFFVLLIGIHTHLGVEAIMVDYLRPAVVGKLIPKLIPLLSLLVSTSVLLLLAWVAIYGNGIAGTLQQLWYLDPTKEPYDEEDSKLKRVPELLK